MQLSLKRMGNFLRLDIIITCCLCVILGLSGFSQGSSFNDFSTAEGVDIKMYPNPAREHFSVEIETPISSITINNILGKEITRYSANTENKYSIGGLRKGIYIVRLFDEKDQLIKAVRLCKS